MKQTITPSTLAQMLMARVYVPFSAVAALSEDGAVTSLCQFDTAFAAEAMTFDANAAEIWLLSNHPEGLRGMTEDDKANLRRLRRAAGRIRVRFFLVGEDTGCTEVETKVEMEGEA